MTLYLSLFCYLHLCPDLSFNISIAFGSFLLPSHFPQVSSLVTKIKDLRGNPGLSLPTLLAKKFSFCFSYCLVDVVGDPGVQIRWFHLVVFCSSGCQCYLLESKKISNDQELTQSDTTPCPQNQKGNNLIHKLTAVYERHSR